MSTLSKTSHKEKLVSESIIPASQDFAVAAMATGAPGIPQAFVWRKEKIDIKKVLEEWKETGACRNGSAERYVRKHWFRVQTVCDRELKIYFERQVKSNAQIKKRWWLYSVSSQMIGE